MSTRSAAALLLAAACAAPRPIVPAAARVGQRVAVAAPDLAGRPTEVGGGPDRGCVAVVELWATWCVPCREAMPALDRLAAELGPRGLRVYGISFDEDPALLPGFLREFPVRFPILWDRSGAVLAARLDVVRLPTRLLIDRRGVLRAVHEGFDAARSAEERGQIEALLAEAPPRD